MTFVNVSLKIMLMIAVLAIVAAPLVSEYFAYRADKKARISYKRFRILVYAVLYAIIVTVILTSLRTSIISLEQNPIVQLLASRFGIVTRLTYVAKLIIALTLNFAIGLLFRLFLPIIRIGMKKLNIFIPNDGENYDLIQRIERNIIRFFSDEVWTIVAETLKYLSAVLSVAYAGLFLLFLIPAVFEAPFFPFLTASTVFSATYVYPVITLLILWESYFFLAGIKTAESECPEVLESNVQEQQVREPVDLKKIDEEIKRQFRNYYVCDVDFSNVFLPKDVLTEHNENTKLIGDAVEADARSPHTCCELYLTCIDKLLESDASVLINGNLFTEFSLYFFRYLSIALARGDNFVIVCNTDTEIDTVSAYVRDALSKISSLYCDHSSLKSVNYDDPIWKIIAVKGNGHSIEEASVTENSILVTSMRYICTERFEKHKQFIHLINTVIFVDTIETINLYEQQLRLLHTKLKHITETNAQKSMSNWGTDIFHARYMSRPIRYICFDDSRTPGLDKVLKNMFSISFESMDAMRFSRQALIRCYNYEGKKDTNGRISSPQFIDSHEEIGVLMNMAILCLANGVPRVGIFADEDIPFENISETISANVGRLPFKISKDAISINQYAFDPNEYSVILAMDHKNNLPRTLRRFVSIPSDKQTLVIVFSRPYLLRDYYSNNISRFWSRMQLAGVPITEGSPKDIIERILVKTNTGGISEDELLKLASEIPQLSDMSAYGDVNEILAALIRYLGICIKESERDIQVFRYFEFITFHQFTNSGEYCDERRILLRQSGHLFDAISGRNMITLKNDTIETVLPLPRTRLSQNYIAGQNMIYNGNIYHIQSIDISTGTINAVLAFGGQNDEAHQYRQVREYRSGKSSEIIENRHVVMKRSEGAVSVSDVFLIVSRMPLEVVTKGYYEISSHAMAFDARQASYHSISDVGNDELSRVAYRRYGAVSVPSYMDAMQSSENGALTLTLRIVGSFGPKKEQITALAAAMLNEAMQSMFPSVSDAVAICPVFGKSFTDEESKEVLSWIPKYSTSDELNADSAIELILIEDCTEDLGVISTLTSMGSDILSTLFAPIYHYLSWYAKEGKKSSYLWYGLDHEPSCFDFQSLLPLAKLLGDNKHDLRFTDIESTIDYDYCDFCGKSYLKAENALQALIDGRRICTSCAKQISPKKRRELKSQLEQARLFIESSYHIRLDQDVDFCYEATDKLIKRLSRAGIQAKTESENKLLSYALKQKVYLEKTIPPINLAELTVRELVHTWQLKHLQSTSTELEQGHIALVALQYLRFLGQSTIARAREDALEKSQHRDGFGYRELLRLMREKPLCRNNPFMVLLELENGGEASKALIEHHPLFDNIDFGVRYTSKEQDRAAGEEIRYYHYESLTAPLQNAYALMLSAIQEHQDSITNFEMTQDDLRKVSLAILYDHPELFYYRTFAKSGETVLLYYGATADEAAIIQKQIEEATPKFLTGIDSSMSAYDVALRIHAKIIDMVDYDTIELERQKNNPKQEGIDRLRTICGPLLDHAAVCEGYARTVQYLLQKCGVECAECTGNIINGGGHAWNIVKIDGDYYYIDTTWDDSSKTSQEVKNTELGFNYFCVTTEEMRRSRNFDIIPTAIPSLFATRANYYDHNDLVIDYYDLARVKNLAERAGKAKQFRLTFKCRTRTVYEETIAQLFGINGKAREIVKQAAKWNHAIDSWRYSYNTYDILYTINIYFQKKKDWFGKDNS